MGEQRKHKRTDIESAVRLHLISATEDKYIDAELDNVSKNGVGFHTREQLLIGEVYEAKIKLWTKDTLDAYLRIVRAAEGDTEGTYSYGSVFVGMMDNELMRILIYQMFQDNENKED